MQYLSLSRDRTERFSASGLLGPIFHTVLLVGLAVTIAGCGSSAKTTLTKEWEAEVGTEAKTVTVEPQRERLIVGKDKDTKIYGADGSVLFGEEEGGLSGMVSKATDAVKNPSPLSADKLDYVVLSDPGLALVFDYTSGDDIVRALNLEGGTKQWERTDYRWSLEKYQSVGADIAKQAFQEMGAEAGLVAGAASGAANQTVLRDRFVSNLVAEVPNQNAILLKTVGELRLVDLQTGATKWTIEDIKGSSLIHTSRLASGDMVLVTTYTSLLGNIQGGKEVIRLDPSDGTVKWRSDHDADAIRSAQRHDNYLLLQHGDKDLEAFRVDDGTEVFEVGMNWKAKIASGMWTVSYGDQRYNVSVAGGPLMGGESVYVPYLSDITTVGRNDWAIRNVSLNTGEKNWESDPVEEMDALQDLTIVNDRLVARAVHAGGGALGSDPRQRVLGWNLSDGTMAWNHRLPYDPSDAFLRRIAALGGKQSASFNLVTADGQAYVAGDSSLTAYRIDDGSEAVSMAPKAPGAPVWITERGQSIVDLRSEGVSFHNKSDLSAARKPIPFQSEIVLYDTEDEYLLARTEEVLYVVNMRKQTLTGKIVQEDVGAMMTSGNLRTGFLVTGGGQSIYYLTKEGVVHKYSIQ